METLQAKDHLTAILLSVFLGMFGVDRFYLGHIKSGVAKLLVGFFTAILMFVFMFMAILELRISDPGSIRLLALISVLVLAMPLPVVIWWIADIVRIATKRLQPKDCGYKNVVTW